MSLLLCGRRRAEASIKRHTFFLSLATAARLCVRSQVVKYAPGYVYGWSNRANVLIAEGDLKGAVSDYDRALELAEGVSMPDKWIIHLNR